MQDSSIYTQIKPQFPEQEHLKCPRCDSMNTKFCYYNNYNLSQPRHFCKNCRRYWTKGGALRNIPVGGGSRKNAKRSSPSSSSSSKRSSAPSSSPPPPPQAAAAASAALQPPPPPPKSEAYGMADLPPFNMNASFTSLLTATSGGQFGNFLDGSDLQLGEFPGNPTQNPGPGPNGATRVGMGFQNTEGFLGGVQSDGGDSPNCWTGANNDWPDLAMYTPEDSNFQ